MTARSRRQYLALAGAATASALAGCLSGLPFASNEREASVDPEDYRVDSSFLEERLTSGTSVPQLNDDPGRWEAEAGEVVVAEDESVSGDESLLLRTDEDQVQATARRTLDEPLSFEDLSVSIAVKWEEPREDYNQIVLTLWDESGDWLELAQSIELFGLNEWQRFDLGVNAVDGDPDLSAITAVSVTTWVDDVTSTVYVDDVRVANAAASSYVVLHFDDIFEGAYTDAFPVLEEYGFPATGGTITNAIGGDRYMSRDQIDDLADAGWEFCSHPHAEQSFVDMDPDDLETLLAEYKAWHADNGFDDALDYIIYPFGEIDDESLEVVARYHKLGFKVPREGYGARVTSPLLCGRVNGDEPDAVRTAVDFAETYRTVVPIMYHDVGTTGEWSVSTEDFEETMRYVDEAEGVEVITTSEWLSMLSGGDS